MKLRNKLLPIIGLSSVVAVATPIALTSCNANSIEKCDIMKYDTSTAAISTKQTPFKTAKEASIFYRDELIKKPTILRDDLRCYHKSLYNTEKAKNDTIKKWEIGVSNKVGIGSVQYWVGGTEYFWPTLTFDYSSDTDVKHLEDDSTEKLEHTVRLQIKWSCSYNNFPFTVSDEKVGTTAEEWNVSSMIADENFFDHLMYIPNWSYTFECETIRTDDYTDLEAKTTTSFTSTYSRSNYIYNYSQFVTLYQEFSKEEESPTPAKFIEWLGMVDFYSNYMHKIPHN